MRKTRQTRLSGNDRWIDLIYHNKDTTGESALNPFALTLGTPNDAEGPIFDLVADNTYWATFSLANDLLILFFCICGPDMDTQALDPSRFSVYSGAPDALVLQTLNSPGMFTGQDSTVFSGAPYWAFEAGGDFPPGDYFVSFSPPLTGSFGLNVVTD